MLKRADQAKNTIIVAYNRLHRNHNIVFHLISPLSDAASCGYNYIARLILTNDLTHLSEVDLNNMQVVLRAVSKLCFKQITRIRLIRCSSGQNVSSQLITQSPG